MSAKYRLNVLHRAITHPKKTCRLASRKMKTAFLWNYYFSSLREPKTMSPKMLQPDVGHIENELKDRGVNVAHFRVEKSDYESYLNQARYERFASYYGGGKASNFAEKSLEHFVAARMLDLSPDDTYIDVASENSPAAEIYHKLFGCKTYRQDLIFPKGVHGTTIGGDACEMPISNDFATKMALHCSFEHFEGDSDIRFIKESSRILKRTGKLCILPLYLFDEYAILTDPVVVPRKGVLFDPEAKLYCTKNWGERHGRFYDVPHFVSRILDNSDLRATVALLQNEKEVCSRCYLKFIVVFQKE